MEKVITRNIPTAASDLHPSTGLCGHHVSSELLDALLVHIRKSYPMISWLHIRAFLAQIAFGLSLGYGIKNKKAAYFCLLVNIICK